MISGIRSFLLSFVLSLLIFGVAGYFLVGFIEDTMTGIFDDTSLESTPESSTEPTNIGTPDNTETTDDIPEKLTILLCGVDDGQSQRNEAKETDVIVLVQIDKLKEEFLFTSFPYDTKVDISGYTLRLGMVYSEFSIDHLISAVKALTGLDIDYYALVEYEGVEKILETIGDIQFNVPMDMYYMPESQRILLETQKGIKPEIDLKMGMQSINAEKAIQLLRYRGYSNGDMGRVLTAKDFIKEVLRQKVTIENLGKAPQIFAALKESVTTNMTDTDFLKNIDLLFSFYKFTAVDIPYPGTTELVNENLFFVPDTQKAMSIFKPYRKVIINN